MNSVMASVQSAPSQLSAWLPSLRWLLHGLLGREFTVITGPEPGDERQPLPRRAVLAVDRLLLPQDLGGDCPERYATCRAAVAHALAHLRYSRPARPLGKLKPMSVAVISALEDTRVERLLARDLPGVRAWFKRGLELSIEDDTLNFSGLMSRLDRALADPARRDGNFWVEKAREMFEHQAAADLHDYDGFRRIGSILANDLGQLRVPYRAQQHLVAAAYRDDHGYLWQLPDPPDPPVPVSFSRAAPAGNQQREATTDLHDETQGAEVELGRFCYPEWDARAGVERHDWTTVIEKRPAWRVAPAVPSSEKLPGSHIVLHPARRVSRTQRRRDFEGENLDINAAVDSMVAYRMRRHPDARVFVNANTVRGGSSVLVLLDLSQSTNDQAHPGGPSLLALERAAALMLVQAVAAGSTGDRVAIHGFHSDGRDRVSYYRMLDFGAALGPAAYAMIGQAPGRYSTRMGAALRHAGRWLAHEPPGQRGLLLLTDGEPSDVDAHLPGYLVEDARAAVNDARRAGIRVHALAVDSGADSYARRIFGGCDFDIVDRPASLAARLRHAYARLCCT